MRRTMILVSLVVAGGVAAAKPLPAGMKIITKLGRPYVQQGQVTVALRDDDIADYEKIVKAELAADGKTIIVHASRCSGSLPDDQTTVPLAKVQARIDSALGLVAQTKKKYAEAITKLTAAAQKDPESPVYASNLLVAQSLGKKLDLASQTLAIHGKRNPAWFAWRLAVDPELAKVKESKSAKLLVAPKAGTATLKDLGERDVAITDVGGGMAAILTTASAAAPNTPGASDLEFVSFAHGRVLLRLPLVTFEDACDETQQHPCSDAAVVRINERRALANQLLGSLGFTKHATGFIDVRNGEPLDKQGLVVTFEDDAITVARGLDAERVLATKDSPWAVAFTPKAVVVRLNRRHLYTCNDASSRIVGAAIAVP